MTRRPRWPSWLPTARRRSLGRRLSPTVGSSVGSPAPPPYRTVARGRDVILTTGTAAGCCCVALNGAPGWWPRAGPPNPFDCFEVVLAEPSSATSEEFFARYPVPVFFEASGVGVRRRPSAGRESALAHRQPGRRTGN